MSWIITAENDEIMINLTVDSQAATNAILAAAAAEASKLAAQQAETNAETAANASQTAQQLAEDASDTATAQAVIATSQAEIATTKASEAATSASNALSAENASEAARDTAITQAGIATTKAGEAATSASNALISENAAEAAANNAVSVVTGGTASFLPTGGKIPIANSQGKINSGWIDPAALNPASDYRGSAIPSTNPGTPSTPVYYIASSTGTYTNFGGLVVTASDGLNVLSFVPGSGWSKIVVPIDLIDYVTKQDVSIGNLNHDPFFAFPQSVKNTDTSTLPISWWGNGNPIFAFGVAIDSFESSLRITSQGTNFQIQYIKLSSEFLIKNGFKNGDKLKWGIWVKFSDASAGSTRRFYASNDAGSQIATVINNSNFNFIENAELTITNVNSGLSLLCGYRDVPSGVFVYFTGLMISNLTKDGWFGYQESLTWNNRLKIEVNNEVNQSIDKDNYLLRTSEQGGRAYTQEYFDLTSGPITGKGVRYSSVGAVQLRLNILTNSWVIPKKDFDRKVRIGLFVKSNNPNTRVRFFPYNEGSQNFLQYEKEINEWKFYQSFPILIPAGSNVLSTASPQFIIIDSFTAANNIHEVCGLTVADVADDFDVSFRFTRQNQKHLLNNVDLLNNIIGKKWCSYGDSITGFNTYQQPVLRAFGLFNYVRGIGGTSVKESGSIAWVDAEGFYLNRPPASQPAGSIQILSSMSNQERINTIPIDSEIITIFAGTNDFDNSSGTLLGTINDNTVNTFYGAYQIMLNRIYTRCPNAIIIMVVPMHRSNENQGFENTREAIRQIAKKYKYRLIDLANIGINQNNHTVYLSDGVHQNAAGANLIATEFINIFKQILSV